MFDDPALTPRETATGDDGSAGGEPADSGPDEETMVDDVGESSEPGRGQPALDVEVIRSKRRTKTAQARLVGSTVEIRIPSSCSSKEEQELIEHFTAKFERSRSTEAIDLEQRAAQLAERYELPKPTSIRWVSNQQYRWGSCTPSDGSIRLSDRLAEFPGWVIDYVMVHELAHLLVSGHDADFWALVEAYPLCERARGFLIAKGLEGD